MQRSISAAAFLHQHLLWRWAACLAAALCACLLMGYHAGSFDHNVHFPFLKAAANPQLYPNDPFLTLHSDQYSFFWQLFLPFQRAGLLEPVLFGVHIITLTLFFGAVWDLSMTLFGQPLAALFAVAAFIVPHSGFVGFPVIEFSLQSRTFVLPFILMSINLFFKNKQPLAFLLLGLMYNINLLMTNFALAMLLVCCLADLRCGGWRRLANCLVSFLLGALPVLIWKLRNGSGLDLSIQPDWLTGVTQGGLFQVFYLFSDKPFMLMTLGGFSALALFGVARSAIGSDAILKKLDLFILALVSLLAIQTLAVYLLPLTFLMQLQINRASLFILVLAYIIYCGYLAKSLADRDISAGDCFLLAGSLFVSLVPILPLLVWLLYKPFRLRMPHPTAWVGAGLALVIGLQMVTAVNFNLWQPGFHIKPRQSDWLNVQMWARENTPNNALFITPPQENGLYQPDWRVHSERGTVASLYDLLEVALKPDYYSTWLERFSAVAPGAFEQFNGIYFDNQAATRNAYHQLSTQQLLDVACTYQATYLVQEKVIQHELPVLYENALYRVYDLYAFLNCN